MLIDRDGQLGHEAERRRIPRICRWSSDPARRPSARALIDALTDRPELQKRVIAAMRISERRWNLRHEQRHRYAAAGRATRSQALDRLMLLQQECAARPAVAGDRHASGRPARAAARRADPRGRDRADTAAAEEAHLGARTMNDMPHRVLPPPIPDRTEPARPRHGSLRSVRRAGYRHHQDRLPDRPHRKRWRAAGARLRLAAGSGRARRQHRRSGKGRDARSAPASARRRTWPIPGCAPSSST